jgi:Helix-turn-helix domain
MSIRVMTAVWDDLRTQAHSELLVLLALADWANDDGYCWPTICALASKARLSERAVQQILGRLTATGRIRRFQGGGRGRSNRYQVVTARNGAAETVNPIHRKENTESKTPNEIHPLEAKRVNLTTEKGEGGAPHTSNTRQKNNNNNTTTSSSLCSADGFDGEANDSSSLLAEELRRVYGLSNSQRDAVAAFIGSHGEEYVRTKWEIVRSQPRHNGAGALLAALRDDWQAPVSYPQSIGPPSKEVRLAAAEARGRERGWAW